MNEKAMIETNDKPRKKRDLKFVEKDGKKKLVKFEIQEGNEIRGFMIRLYPDRETEEKLLTLMDDCRIAWNWLVSQKDNAREANAAYAVAQKLVPPRPSQPRYEGLDPETSKRTRAEYRSACERWHFDVLEVTRKLPECSYRSLNDLLAHYGCKHDYQLLDRVIGWSHAEDEVRIIKPASGLLQAVTKNFFQKSERRKKHRRRIDPMPLQNRSTPCFELGDFGARGKDGKTFYNCLVKINGLRIRGRLPGVAPTGRVLQGVSISKRADGWWASIKEEVPKRALEPAVPGSVVGLDVGLDNIVAMSNGARIPNARNRAYAERIAGRQAMKLPTGRIEQSARKHILHVIHNEIVKPLARVETIKVERLNSQIGQMGSTKKSTMRLIIQMLKQRYGDRVVEVDPRYTSQECSACGHRCKEAWSYERGRYGTCPQCGHHEDRDVNAACNIAKRPALPPAVKVAKKYGKKTEEEVEIEAAAE